MDWGMRYLSALTCGIEAFQKSGAYTDVTVLVDGKDFRCHKVVLCALSPYFNAMFSTDMRESQENSVSLPLVNAATFSSLLSFFYSGDDIVSSKNAENILQAACFMQIECLQARCEEFLSQELDTGNCIHYWKLAQQYDCAVLAREAWEFILENFTDIAGSAAFFDLDSEEFLKILNDEDLVAPNEELICDAAMAWIEKDMETRKTHLGNILEALRFPLTSGEYLCHATARYPFLDEIGRKFLDEARTYHMVPARQQEFASLRTEHRKFSELEDVIVLVGGCTDETERRTREVICFSSYDQGWYHLAPLPYDPGLEFATCGFGKSDLYVSGGGKVFRGMVKYSGQSNTWVTCPSMTFGRRRHAMVAVGHSLFAIGGYNDEKNHTGEVLGSIEEYNLAAQEWTAITDLIEPVESMSVAVLGDRILIFGGSTSDDEDTESIQCYDTRLQTAILVGDLPSAERLTRAIGFNDSIYIITMDGIVLHMAGIAKCEQAGEISEFDRYAFCAVLHKSGFLILGGKNEETLYDDILFYDNASKEVQVWGHLPSPRTRFGCTKLCVRKKYFMDPV